MKKFCVLFSLLTCTMVFTACGAGIKYSSDSNSSGSKQTKNAELVDLGSDPQAYMLYGTYRIGMKKYIKMIPIWMIMQMIMII